MLVLRSLFETGQCFLVTFEAVEDITLADVGVGMRVVELEGVLITGQCLIKTTETFECRPFLDKRVRRAPVETDIWQLHAL